MEFQAGLAGPSMSVAFGQLQSNFATYWPALLGGTLIMSVLDVAAAANGGGQAPLFLYSLIGMIITLLATAAALRALTGQQPRQPMPIGGYVLGGIVSGLATLLGFVMLILPGLFLLGRWALMVVVLEAEGVPAMESLRRSWELTERDWLAATIIFVLAGLGNFAGGAVVELLSAQGWPMLIGGSLIGNAITSVATVWSCIATVALYRFITGSVSQVDEIFG